MLPYILFFNIFLIINKIIIAATASLIVYYVHSMSYIYFLTVSWQVIRIVIFFKCPDIENNGVEKLK